MKIVHHRAVYPRPLKLRIGIPLAPEEAPKPERCVKKALLIGINYDSLQPTAEKDSTDDSDKENAPPQDDSDMPPTKNPESNEEEAVTALQGPHHDVLDMREFLVSM